MKADTIAVIKNRAVDLSRICILRYEQSHHAVGNASCYQTYTSNAFINTTLLISIVSKNNEKIMNASTIAVIKNRAVDQSPARIGTCDQGALQVKVICV